MVETIFRVILIILVITIILAVVSTLGVNFNIGFSFNTDQFLQQILSVACYIFPFKALLPILVVIISVTLFKIGIAILKTIWDIFPFSP